MTSFIDTGKSVFPRLCKEFQCLRFQDKIMILIAGGWGLWLFSFVLMANMLLDVIQSPKSQAPRGESFMEKLNRNWEADYKDFERMHREFKELTDRMNREHRQFRGTLKSVHQQLEKRVGKVAFGKDNSSKMSLSTSKPKGGSHD